MTKAFIVLLSILYLALAQCPSQNAIANFQAGSFTFQAQNIQTQLTSSQPITSLFRQTPLALFNMPPNVCIGINGIQTQKLLSLSFGVKPTVISTTYLQFTASYYSNIWSKISITFLISSRSDIFLGSFNQDLNSLKGASKIVNINLQNALSDSNSAISRIFLNGYSLNTAASNSLQIYLSQNSISSNQLAINVKAGNDIDLKTITIGYIVFIPNSLPFSSYGQIFTQSSFENQKSKNLIQNIGILKYYLYGIMSLKQLKAQNSFSCSAILDSDFIFTEKTNTKIDQISFSYVIFGVSSKKACEKCGASTIQYQNNCLSTCSSDTYKLDLRDTGSSCQKCSTKLGLQLKSDKSGCQCAINYSINSQTGKCQLKYQTSTYGIGSNLNTVNFVSQISSQILNNDKNSFNSQEANVAQSQRLSVTGSPICEPNKYWTGKICRCVPGFIENNNICIPESQNINNYVYLVARFVVDDNTNSYLGSCQNGQYFNQATNSCQCVPGLGRYQNQCQQCPQNYFLTNDKICATCPSNKFFNSQIQQCQCINGFVQSAYESGCTCPPGYTQRGQYCQYGSTGNCYDNQIKLPNGICQNCSYNQIVSNNICVCKFGYQSINGACTNNPNPCKENQYPTNPGCKQCPDFSKYDFSLKQCKCISGYNKIKLRQDLQICVNIGGGGESNCKSDQYKDYYSNKCQKCDQSCKKCQDGDGTCLQCKNSTYKIQFNKCVFEVKPFGICSNGKIQGNQQCDDGNKENNDGCSDQCKKQDGFSCTHNNSYPATICKPQISIVLIGEAKSNSQNVFANFRTYPVFNLTEQQKKDFIKFSFSIPEAKPEKISCRQQIKTPQIFSCFFYYPKGKPVKVFSVTASFNKSPYLASTIFKVDPLKTLSLLNPTL